MRWIATKEESDYMQERKRQNAHRSKFNAAENWMAAKLKTTGFNWSRQVIWGYRIFDFWHCVKGIAIEVDGAEHDGEYDAYRDRYTFLRSGVVVIRVRNFNEDDARIALWLMDEVGEWKQRKERIGAGKDLVLAHGMKLAKSPVVAKRKAAKQSLELGI